MGWWDESQETRNRFMADYGAGAQARWEAEHAAATGGQPGYAAPAPNAPAYGGYSGGGGYDLAGGGQGLDAAQAMAQLLAQLTQQWNLQWPGVTGYYDTYSTPNGERTVEQMRAELAAQDPKWQTEPGPMVAAEYGRVTGGSADTVKGVQKPTLPYQQWQTSQTGYLNGDPTMARQTMDAALTGMYGGNPTVAYQQLVGDMTGQFNGNPTMAYQQWKDSQAQNWANLTGYVNPGSYGNYAGGQSGGGQYFTSPGGPGSTSGGGQYGTYPGGLGRTLNYPSVPAGWQPGMPMRDPAQAGAPASAAQQASDRAWGITPVAANNPQYQQWLQSKGLTDQPYLRTTYAAEAGGGGLMPLSGGGGNYYPGGPGSTSTGRSPYSGYYPNGGGYGQTGGSAGIPTFAREQWQQQLEQWAKNFGMQQGALTGRYNGQDTLQRQQLLASMSGPKDWIKYQALNSGGGAFGAMQQTPSWEQEMMKSSGYQPNGAVRQALSSVKQPIAYTPQTWNKLGSAGQQMQQGTWSAQGIDPNDAMRKMYAAAPTTAVAKTIQYR